MYEIFLTSEFKKDAKKLNKNDLALVGEILDKLAAGATLEPRYKDHALIGNFKE